MIAKLEIFGLKYSELFACHKMICGHISYNYSNSSENGIWKKHVSLAMVTRQFIQTFAKKKSLFFSLKELLKIWLLSRDLNFIAPVKILDLL